MELVEPVFDVRQQEMAHLVLAVVEEFRIPVGLVARLARRRVEMVRAVEFVDPLVEVLHVVGVHEVHDDREPQLVSPADQLFQLLGRTAARCRGEEARHVVAERTVVGVFGHGHQLHGVVAVLLDDREYLFGEFAVGAHALALLGHAHVGFVDQQAADLRGVEGVAPPVERLRGRPELRGVVLRRLVLHDARGVGRNAVQPAVVTVDVEFVERAVHQPVAVHRRGEKGAPHPRRVAVHADLGALPVVEVAEDVDIVRPRQPLAEPPSVEFLVALPAEIAVAVGVVHDRPRSALDPRHLPLVLCVAAVHMFFDGLQPCVALYDGQSSGRFFHRRCWISIKYDKNRTDSKPDHLRFGKTFRLIKVPLRHQIYEKISIFVSERKRIPITNIY